MARRHSLQRTSSRSSSVATLTGNDAYRQKPRPIAYSNKGDRPLLGGMYFSDLVVIFFTYTLNLLRTLGFAELADIIFNGFVYTGKSYVSMTDFAERSGKLSANLLASHLSSIRILGALVFRSSCRSSGAFERVGFSIVARHPSRQSYRLGSAARPSPSRTDPQEPNVPYGFRHGV